jgi:hypothetical protein
VLPLVSNDVVETLRWYFKTHYPSHYLSQLWTQYTFFI